MKFAEVARVMGLVAMVCAAAVVPALTMGGRTVADPLRVGDIAPALTLSEWVTGAPVTFGAGDGLIAVIVFWGTYCPPCREAMPVLSQIHERFAADGVRVVCVGHESREKTRAYLNEFGPPLRQSFALDRDWTTTRPYLEGLGVLGIPYAVIVAPDGTIAWHGDPMSDELVEALRSLI